MALDYQGIDLSYMADAAIPQYRCVRIVATGHVSLPAAAKGGPLIGITQDSAAASGDIVRVRRVGLSKAMFGTAASVGQTLSSHDANGMVGVPATAWSSGDDIIGACDSIATTSGDICAVWVNAREVL